MRFPARLIYMALAIATIALGLLVHWGAPDLDADVRDILGDAVWATMMLWLVSGIAPRLGLISRGCSADRSGCSEVLTGRFLVI